MKALALTLAALAIACGGSSRPACQPDEQEKHEAAFRAELEAACVDEPGELESCTRFDSIRAKYEPRRRDLERNCQ